MNVSNVCCSGSDLKYCIENVSSSYKKLPLTDYRTNVAYRMTVL